MRQRIHLRSTRNFSKLTFHGEQTLLQQSEAGLRTADHTVSSNEPLYPPSYPVQKISGCNRAFVHRTGDTCTSCLTCDREAAKADMLFRSNLVLLAAHYPQLVLRSASCLHREKWKRGFSRGQQLQRYTPSTLLLRIMNLDRPWCTSTLDS